MQTEMVDVPFDIGALKREKKRNAFKVYSLLQRFKREANVLIRYQKFKSFPGCPCETKQTRSTMNVYDDSINFCIGFHRTKQLVNYEE
jgi:hypothetical protein